MQSRIGTVPKCATEPGGARGAAAWETRSLGFLELSALLLVTGVIGHAQSDMAHASAVSPSGALSGSRNCQLGPMARESV